MKEEKKKKEQGEKVSKNKNVEYDKYSDKLGPLYTGPSLDERYMKAKLALGISCPVCRAPWTAVEVVHNAALDKIQLNIECFGDASDCNTTHHVIYDDDTGMISITKKGKKGDGTRGALNVFR
jgi:hypothetical protein